MARACCCRKFFCLPLMFLKQLRERVRVQLHDDDVELSVATTTGIGHGHTRRSKTRTRTIKRGATAGHPHSGGAWASEPENHSESLVNVVDQDPGQAAGLFTKHRSVDQFETKGNCY